MSRWIDQFKNHPFHADWARLTELVSTPLPNEQATTVTVAQEYARLCKVIQYVRGVMENLDPELLPNSYLNNLHSYVQQTINELSAFNSNGNLSHLHNANGNADQFMALSLQAPFSPLGITKANLTKTATAYAEALDRHAVAYAKRTDDLVENSAQKLKQIDDRLANSNEELTKLEGRVAGVETTVQSQLSTFNSTFQASESTRATNFDTWFGKFQDKAVEDYTKLTEQNAAGLLAMQSYQDDAETVLGTVIDTAQAGAYAKYANEEKVSANWYRRMAISSMAAAALVMFAPEAISWLQQAATYTIDWKRALYRLPFSLILFAPALYLAKESSRHRTNEVLNRRRQHILTTIGPYLALLPKDKADAIKADVAKNIFSESLQPLEDKAPDAGAIAMQVSQLFSSLAKSK